MDKLFSNKRTYIDSKGDEIFNMFTPTIPLDKIVANGVMRLNKSHNGRLDRFVWDNVSRDIDSGLDMIMYVNHIFNPFAVQDGDMVFIPVVNGDIYQTQSEPSLPDGTTVSKKINNEKQMTYAERVEYYSKLGLGVS